MEVTVPSWILVASGELGDLTWWEQEFAKIERAQNLLCLLEEIGEENVDWSYLLEGLPRLKSIRSMPFPPLYGVDEFGAIDGFSVEMEEPEVEYPGTSFMQVKIEVFSDDVDEISGQFGMLVERLESYPPLQGYL